MTVRRPAFTLVEMLAVMAVLIILASIMVPAGVRMFSRDTQIQAATDVLRGRIAEARGEAMEHGRPYRLAVSEDGTKVRIAPDEQNFGVALTTTDDEVKPRIVEADLPKDVIAKCEPPDGSAPATDADGWIRIATFQPDGTCREDAVVIRLTQPNMYPVLIRIRGLTGATTVEAEKRRPGGNR